ncbi:hypothetical protein ACOSQ3_032320 [Xanthoceras sorbifolium]
MAYRANIILACNAPDPPAFNSRNPRGRASPGPQARNLLPPRRLPPSRQPQLPPPTQTDLHMQLLRGCLYYGLQEDYVVQASITTDGKREKG